jgi:hypothetical protein
VASGRRRTRRWWRLLLEQQPANTRWQSTTTRNGRGHGNLLESPVYILWSRRSLWFGLPIECHVGGNVVSTTRISSFFGHDGRSLEESKDGTLGATGALGSFVPATQTHTRIDATRKSTTTQLVKRGVSIIIAIAAPTTLDILADLSGFGEPCRTQTPIRVGHVVGGPQFGFDSDTSKATESSNKGSFEPANNKAGGNNLNAASGAKKGDARKSCLLRPALLRPDRPGGR